MATTPLTQVGKGTTKKLIMLTVNRSGTCLGIKSFTEVKMGRWFNHLQKIKKTIIEQCQNNVPQCQILKAWNLSPPTVHNIIRRV